MDNVHYVINKENTQALNVEYISIVPLVTPFVDGSNQAQIVRALEFDYMYYYKTTNDVQNYPFPFEKTEPVRDFDYLDYVVYVRMLNLFLLMSSSLNSRNNIMAADWDTPIKQYSVVRNSTFPSAGGPIPVNDTSVQNSQYAATVTSTNTVIQQVFPALRRCLINHYAGLFFWRQHLLWKCSAKDVSFCWSQYSRRIQHIQQQREISRWHYTILDDEFSWRYAYYNCLLSKR